MQVKKWISVIILFGLAGIAWYYFSFLSNERLEDKEKPEKQVELTFLRIKTAYRNGCWKSF
jgi:hypothetical protein